MTKSLIAAFTLCAALTAAATAHAAPIIRLSDGTDSVEVSDNDANDMDASSGRIEYTGVIGANWLSNMTIGSSGAPTDPRLRLEGLHASNVGTGGVSLDVYLTDTNFSVGSLATFLSFAGSIEGETNGMVTWNLYVDDGNNAFGLTDLIATGTNPSDIFSSAVGGSALLDGAYSMTLHVRINHGNGEYSTRFTFDSAAQLVPEPGTLLLLGVGLAGLALRRRH